VNAILDAILPTHKYCVEFGAFDLRQYSNTYPLWADLGWNALLIEGDGQKYQSLRQDYANLCASGRIAGQVQLLNRMVGLSDNDSIDAILKEVNAPRDLDFMSIDVDGIDCDIFASLTAYRPRLLAVEFNPTLPPDRALRGSRTGNYIGCSVHDLVEIGRGKGYDLVACTDTNAFFVDSALAAPFANRNDISQLFDRRYLTYVLNAYDGGIAFSQSPVYRARNPKIVYQNARARANSRDKGDLVLQRPRETRPVRIQPEQCVRVFHRFFQPIKKFWRRLVRESDIF
jgi:hypothetical protein